MLAFLRSPATLAGVLILALGVVVSCASLQPGGSIHQAAVALAPTSYSETYISDGRDGHVTGTAVVEHGGGLGATVGGVAGAAGAGPFGPIAGTLIGALGAGIAGYGASKRKDGLIVALTHGIEAGADPATKEAVRDLTQRFGVAPLLEGYLQRMGPLAVLLGHYLENAAGISPPPDPPASAPTKAAA